MEGWRRGERNRSEESFTKYDGGVGNLAAASRMFILKTMKYAFINRHVTTTFKEEINK